MSDKTFGINSVSNDFISGPIKISEMNYSIFLFFTGDFAINVKLEASPSGLEGEWLEINDTAKSNLTSGNILYDVKNVRHEFIRINIEAISGTYTLKAYVS